MSEEKKLTTEEKLAEARRKYRKPFAFEKPNGRRAPKSYALLVIERRQREEAKATEDEISSTKLKTSI